MQYGVFVLLAACSSGAKQPAPAPAPVPVAATDPAPEPAPVPVLVTCPALPNAARGGIRLTWINETPFEVDLCPAVDRALGKLDRLERFQSSKFELAIILSTEHGTDQTLSCKVSVHTSAKHHPIGDASATSVMQRREDCIDAVLDDVMRNKVGRSLQLHTERVLHQPSSGPP